MISSTSGTSSSTTVIGIVVVIFVMGPRLIPSSYHDIYLDLLVTDKMQSLFSSRESARLEASWGSKELTVKNQTNH
jgi:hypothetical protein